MAAAQNPRDKTTQELLAALNEVLTTKGATLLGEWSDTLLLAEKPLEFDSLDLAQLSVALEERFGSDPYSSGEMPYTLGDLKHFYHTTETGS